MSQYRPGRGELRRELTRCLRSGRTSPKAQGAAKRTGPLANMVMISKRPAEADDRAIPEGDLDIGKNGASAAGIPVYFCDSHSPWQRGSNDNTNGLLPKPHPKSADVSAHSAEDRLASQRSLIGRLRKTLGCQMPEEELAEIVALST